MDANMGGTTADGTVSIGGREYSYRSNGSHVALTATVGRDVNLGAGAWVDFRATVDNGVVIDDGGRLSHHVTVGARTHIGEGAVLHPFAWVGNDVTISPGVTVGAGAVVISTACVKSDVGPGVFFGYYGPIGVVCRS